MTDSKRNRVSVKINEETLLALKKEKRRIEAETGVEPDYADLIGPLVEHDLGLVPHQSASRRKHEKWFSMLEDVLTSGHQAAISAITENLIAFHRLVEVDTTKASRKVALGE